MEDNLNSEITQVNKGTSMDSVGIGSMSCKYCSFRLSKLQMLDRARTNVDQSSDIHIRSSKQRKLLVDRSCQTSAGLFEKAEMTQKELRSLAMILRYRNSKALKSETFCKCVKQGKERDCQCGEDEKCKFDNVKYFYVFFIVCSETSSCDNEHCHLLTLKLK